MRALADITPVTVTALAERQSRRGTTGEARPRGPRPPRLVRYALHRTGRAQSVGHFAFRSPVQSDFKPNNNDDDNAWTWLLRSAELRIHRISLSVVSTAPRLV